MDKLKELKEARAKLITDNQKVTGEWESRDATDDEIKTVRENQDKIAACDKDIAAAQEVRALADQAAAQTASLDDLEPRKAPGMTPGKEPTEKPAPVVEAGIRRNAKLRAFTGDGGIEEAYTCGQMIVAREWPKNSPARRRAQTWLDEHPGAMRRAMSEGTDSAGGVFVPSPMAARIIDLKEEYGVFRANCDVVPMSGDTLEWPRVAGQVTAYWGNENTALTESEMTFDAVNLTAKKLTALTLFSTELADDAIVNVADKLAVSMAYQFAKMEDDAGFKGDGTAAYGSITGITAKMIDGSHTESYVTAATDHDTFAEIDASDLAKTMGALPTFAEANPKWYISKPGYANVFGRLTAAAGGNTIEGMESGSRARSYMGYPIVVSQSLPTVLTDLSSKIMLLFGDLAMAATLGSRTNIEIAVSDQRYFEKDQVAIRAKERLDINIHSLGDNTNAGALIGLLGH